LGVVLKYRVIFDQLQKIIEGRSSHPKEGNKSVIGHFIDDDVTANIQWVKTLEGTPGMKEQVPSQDKPPRNERHPRILRSLSEVSDFVRQQE